MNNSYIYKVLLDFYIFVLIFLLSIVASLLSFAFSLKHVTDA